MTKKQEACVVCCRVDAGAKMRKDNAIWECSHVDCPNRRRITAGPSDELDRDSDFNLTSHFTPKDIES